MPPDGEETPAQEETAAEDHGEGLIVKVSELIGDEFEGDNLRLHGFSQPSNGRLTDNGDGTLSFTPNSDWDGSTLLEYTVIDDSGRTAVGRLIVELDPEDGPLSEEPSAAAPQTSSEISNETSSETPAHGDGEQADLYAGARYEDVELDEEDRLIGDSAEEMPYLSASGDDKIADSAPTYSDAWAGSDGSDGASIRPLESAAETPAKKPKKRKSNAAAAEELFKKLDW